MYNFKANSIKRIVPRHISDNYPQFENFLKVYYQWQEKTTVVLEGVIGNFSFSDYMYAASSGFSSDLEVSVDTNESVITDFNSAGRKTFIRGENVISYTKHNEPVTITINSKNEYLFNDILQPKISLFRTQTYYFENNSGSPFYIKDRKTSGGGNQYPEVVNNGASSGIISIEITNETPKLLYYTIGTTGNIGTFDVRTMLTQLRVDLADSQMEDISVFGYGRTKDILFHPEYLYTYFDELSSIHAPDAFFSEYLAQYGLDTFFRNNFKSRKAIQDFIRFFQKKGTEDAIKFFFRNFFSKDVSLSYPGERVLRASDSKYFLREQLYVSATDKGIEFTRNRRIRGELSNASAIIEAYTFDTGRGYYKLYLDKNKIVGAFLVDERILVIDDDDSSIEYDTDGRVMGTVSDFQIIEPGEGYEVDQTITNTYNIAGEALIVTLNVTDITSSPIYYPSIELPGSGYAVGDEILFPKPEKKTRFYGIIQSNNIGENTYTDYDIHIDFQDTDGYTLSYPGATTNFFGIVYNIVSYDGVDNILRLDTELAAPTVASGNILFVDFPEQNVTDPYYNESFFHPRGNVNKKQAKATVSSVTTSGEIESIAMDTNGAGYVVRPSTDNGGIHITTVSGEGANITVSGQGFGGLLDVSNENDIIGTKFDILVTLQKTGTVQDGDAKIRMLANPTSPYGKFFEDNKGFISDKIFIHDSYYYQDYSYVIESDLNFSDFAELYRKLAHPAGLIFFNQYFIINYFNQKINRGSDIPITPFKIMIEKTPDYGLEIDFSLLTIQDISKFIFTTFQEQYLQQFHWYSESLLDMWNDYQLTYSGTPIETFSGVSLSQEGLVPREFDGESIGHERTIHIFATVSGTGTISFSDTTTSGEYSSLFTVSGTSSTFTTKVGKDDLLIIDDETLIVNNIVDDTELIAQRINTTASGITSTVDIINQSYDILQKRRTELHNANTVDILQLGDINTLGDDDIIDTQVQNIDTVFINI